MEKGIAVWYLVRTDVTKNSGAAVGESGARAKSVPTPGVRRYKGNSCRTEAIPAEGGDQERRIIHLWVEGTGH